MRIEIFDLPKVSFNVYNHLHWAKKKQLKDIVRMLVTVAYKGEIKERYNLDFIFYFKGRRLDRVNVFHFVKIIEDKLFPQDKDNGWIKVDTRKGSSNRCVLILTKIEEELTLKLK